LRCAFNQAVKWEYIAKNPFLNATLPEHKERKRQALSPEQLHKVLEFTDRPEIYDWYLIHCAIQLAFACSMRGGEVCGSQWDRFDSVSKMLYVDRVIDRVDKKLMEKLPKMDIKFKFPNLFPGTRTVIVLKQPKTEGSIRNVYTPDTVAQKLLTLRRMQDKLKLELGDDAYMDYGLIICQANGRPIMTEQLNKRFKDILAEMNLGIDLNDIVFHSLRHTSAGVKLRLSKGDLKAVQGDGGWNTPDMVTKRYAHILDEDRINLADEMEKEFYKSRGKAVAPKGKPDAQPAPALDAKSIATLLTSNPDLLMKVFQSVQFANPSPEN
jgi:integrase